jgi:hypothetical protein
VEMDGKRVARVKIERILSLSDAQKIGLPVADSPQAATGMDAVKSHSDSSARTP